MADCSLLICCCQTFLTLLWLGVSTGQQFVTPNANQLNELENVITEKGEDGVVQYVRQKQNGWRNIDLDIAVVGSSGVGKSSFINAIRGLTADDEGAAEVGVTETTATIEAYAHPNNGKLQFWDLPGVGTPKFPKTTYVEDINITRYDFFLLITSTRFTENDLWLAKQLREHHKQFYFMRNKVGVDVSSDKLAHPRTHNTTQVLEKIRESTKKQLAVYGFDDIPVFLIDTFNPREYDFDELEVRLLTEYPALKRTAFILSLQVTSEKTMKVKSRVLRSDMWRSAVLAGLKSVIHIPILSFKIDLSIIKSQREFYRDQLGLDDYSLHRYARITGTEFNDLEQIVRNSLDPEFFTERGIRSFVASLPPRNPTLLEYIPIISSMAAYHSTVIILEAALGKLEATALEVIRYPAQKRHNVDRDEF